MFDEKCISGVLKLQTSVSIQGLRSVEPDQGLPWIHWGVTAPTNPQLLNCKDCTEPGNFR